MVNFASFPDEDLAILARTKDPKAYELLVQRHKSGVIKYIEGLVGNEMISHKLAQETFLKSYAHLNDFNPSQKFSLFLYRIASLVTLHFLQKKGVKSLGEQEQLSEEFLQDEDSHEELKDPLFKKKLSRALPKLKVQYRAPVLLHYVQNYSYNEIGDILLLPVSVIETRVLNAKKQIEKHG